MRYHLEVTRRANLPRLGWVATLEPASHTVRADIGPAVEQGASFIVEGLWDGDFASGRFAASPVFFGSGLVVDDAQVTIVPSRAPIDRVVYAYHGGQIVVANSVAILLAKTGARLDPDHDYVEESITIGRGLDDYVREFRVIHPEIPCFFQHYFDNLVLEGDRLVTQPAPLPPAPDSYEDYRTKLDAYLDAMATNLRDPRRQTPMEPFVTVSAGYDSPAVACIVRRIGIKACYSSQRSNTLFPSWLAPDLANDDGTPIAKILGLETRTLVPADANIPEDDELVFLASNRANPELAFWSLARDIERSGKVGVVFTGYLGDLIWGLNPTEAYLKGRLVRSDSAGLGLSEARIHKGFIHLPLGFIFGTHVGAMVAISRAAEQDPWRLGVDYDRPIPRRILETAGVPRHLFGQKKRAVVKRYDMPYNRALRSAFFRALGVRPSRAYAIWAANEGAYRLERLVVYARARGDRHKALKVGYAIGAGRRLLPQIDFRRHMYLMAASMLSARAAAALEEAPAS